MKNRLVSSPLGAFMAKITVVIAGLEGRGHATKLFLEVLGRLSQHYVMFLAGASVE